MPEGPLRAQHFAQLVPVDDGHHDVEKNERRLQLLGGVQSCPPVGQRRDVVLVSEKFLDDGEVRRVVIDRQDFGTQRHAEDSLGNQG